MNQTQLERFFQNRASAQERREVIDWLLDPRNDPEISIWLKRSWDQIAAYTSEGTAMDPDMERIWSKILNTIEPTDVHIPSVTTTVAPPSTENHTPLAVSRSSSGWMNRFARFTLAAVVLGIFAGLSYFIVLQFRMVSAPQTSEASLSRPDIAPPRDARAVLTLADGSKVYLDNTVNGTLATQGNVEVLRNEKGEIVYTGDASVTTYNTLSIPRGSKPIRLVLADGSLVWLNAASSLTYPTAFSGNERRVSMTGEAYFEVAKTTGIPFFVEQGNLKIQVLGTHFNVNGDEEDKTTKVTLLEGSVKVSSTVNAATIVPGQQATLKGNKLNVVDGVDTEEVMAWKNGQFFFTGTGIREIMHQVEKYYDVEVEFRDEVPYQFVAKISRDVNVSTFLEKLELTNLIHFKIEDKKIVVMK